MWIDMLVLLIGLLGFACLVTVHESGHFAVAKWFRMLVYDFSIGMGKRLFGFRFRETDYNVRLLPIGGFVNIHGEQGSGGQQYRRKLSRWLGNRKVSDASRSLARDRRVRYRPWHQQLLVAAAGPAASIVLGFLLFLAVGLVYGVVTEKPTVGIQVLKPMPGSPAESAGVQPGDLILAVNGRSVSTVRELTIEIALGGHNEQRLALQRGETQLSVSILPKLLPNSAELQPRFGAGVWLAPRQLTAERGKPLVAVAHAWHQTISMVSLQCRGLWSILTGKIDITQTNGPVGTLYVISASVYSGIVQFVSLLAVISIGLSVMNMIPLLPLDGGRILFALLHGWRGKPVPYKVQFVCSACGACLLFGLMLMTVYFDSRSLSALSS